MAENEYCAARYTHMGGKPDTTFVEHHEWRFLRQRFIENDSPSPSDLHNVFYCIFCLKLENRKVKYGIAN